MSSPLKKGDIVRLVNLTGKNMKSFDLKFGDVGLVVNGQERYPELYKQLRRTKTEAEIDENMVCVEWARPTSPNGYFHLARFVKIGETCSANVDLKKLN